MVRHTYRVKWSVTHIGSYGPSHIWGHMVRHTYGVKWSVTHMGSNGPSHIWGHMVRHTYGVIWSVTHMGSYGPSHIWGQMVRLPKQFDIDRSKYKVTGTEHWGLKVRHVTLYDAMTYAFDIFTYFLYCVLL